MKIKINNIFLLANDFIRGNQIKDDIIHNINADLEIKYDFISDDKKNIGVMFSYKMEIPSDIDNKPQVFYSSVHYAELELEKFIDDEENNRYIDKFINVNVAAMIFPFIREHLANTTMKSGMSPILVPAINFIDRYNKLKEFQNSTE